MRYLSCLFLGLILAACAADTAAQQRLADRAYIERSHDSLMALMPTVSRTARALTQYRDSLQTAAPVDSGIVTTLNGAVAQLRGAEDAMNRWMESYNVDSAQAETKAGSAYLAAQRQQVAQLETAFAAAIAQGQAVAGSYQVPLPAAAAASSNPHNGHSGHSH